MTKTKKLLLTLGGALILALTFAGGMYANDWLSHTGEEDLNTSSANVDEIMDILREVREGKLSAEEAVTQLEARVAELEDMNPSGLAKQNKELREQVEELQGIIDLRDHTIAGLESDLEAAQGELADAQQALENKQGELNDKQVEIDEKNGQIDALQTERDNLQTEVDNLKAQVDSNADYVQHLETELEQANQMANDHLQETEDAVQEARTYQE